MKTRIPAGWLAATVLTLTGCSAANSPASTSSASGAAEAAPVIAARVQTEAAVSGEAAAAVLVLDPADAGRSRIVAATALGGLEVYDLAGQRLASAEAGDVAAVDAGYQVMLGGQPSTVLVAIDTTGNRLRLYRMDAEVLTEVGARPLPLGFAGEGVCLYRNPLDEGLHAFIVGDGGEIDQQLIFPTADGKLDARQVRRISVPSTLKQCVAASDGQVYAAEETVGIWRITADAEADVAAVLIDSPRSGRFAEEIGGLAIHDGGEGSRWLIASDANGSRLNVYDRDQDDAYAGSFALSAGGGNEAVEEPGPLFATSLALGDNFPQGLLLVTDEEGPDFKLLSFADVAAGLDLAPGTAQDPRQRVAAAVPVVRPSHEAVPVRSYGDAADDPAIWAHPTEPAASLIIATDKKAGLTLYDMQGKEVQFLADGKMNNVDFRDGFELGGKMVTLVAASDRTRKAIALYVLDADSRRLVPVADGVQATGLEDPYGLCMYRSAKTGKTFVFVNSGDGPLNQWELVDAGNGKVKSVLVRETTFESQTEGCVADDHSGALFIGEEDVALWRLDAEPDGGDTRTVVDRVDANPAIKDDLEGVGLYDLGDGRGYLVVSSQGNDTYAVYRREGDRQYLGSFAVAADGVRGVDGISETDGLDVSSANLGPGFENGAMVAQDGRNVLPAQNQNYKIVPWSAIAEALELDVREH